MKKLAYLLGALAVFALAVVGCTKPPQETPEPEAFLTIEKDTLWVPAIGTPEPEFIKVYASTKDWTASTEADWLTVEPTYDLVNDYLNVMVGENTGETTRETTIWLYNGDVQAQLVVVQFADTRVEATRIIPSDTLYIAQKSMGSLEIPIVADGVYEVSVDKSWLYYAEQVTKDGQVSEKFDYDGSYDKAPRYATVTFSSEETSTSVRVMQWGSQVLFVTAPETLNYMFTKSVPQTITVMANGDWLPVVEAEWVDFEVKEGGLVDTLVVSVADNEVAEARNATLTISCGDENVEIKVSQDAKKEFGDVAEMEYPSDVKVSPSGATASTYYSTSYKATAAIDDPTNSTYWRANYTSDTDPWIEIEFDPSTYTQIDYVMMTPYSSLSDGHWGEVDIYVTDQNGKETKVQSHDFGMSSGFSIVEFEKPLVGVTKVRFHVLTSKNTYTTEPNASRRYVSVQDLSFYTKDAQCDPLTVFTDWSLSELRPEVTLEQIEALPVELYRTIAEKLYYGVYDGEFRICKFKAFPHPDRDAAIFRTNTYTLLDNVTGMYVAEAGDTVHVYLDDTHDLSIRLRVIDWVNFESFSATTSDRSYVKVNGSYQYVTHSFPLRKGHNEIVTNCRGLMYLMCHTDNYESIPEMTAHFVTGEVNGYIELGKTDISRSYELLRMGGNTEPHFDMLSHRALLNFPKTIFYNGTFKKNPDNNQRVEDLLHIFDTVMYIQEDIQGHYKYKALGQQRVHRNRALYHGTYTSYYGASSAYRTYYNVTSMATGIVDPTDQWKKNVTHYSNDVVGSIWGLAHELGHTNQTELFKWRGLTEVTNNLMCAITQMVFYGEGNTTMRFNDHFNKGMRDIVTRVMWDFDEEGNWAERPMTHSESVNTPSVGNITGGVDPTTQLMPFWQLYLYYHKVLGKTDFYPDFYESCRVKDMRSANYSSADAFHSAMTLEYMKTASDAAGEDLSDFCNAWGLPGVNEARGVNKGMKVNHYGENYITTSADEVAASVAYCNKYAKPKMNPLYIHDLNLDLYRNPQPVVAGTHSVDDNGNFTVSGWQNVVAWVLVDPTKQDIRTGEMGRVVAIKKWDDTKNGGFQYGLQESRYIPKDAEAGDYSNYKYSDSSSYATNDKGTMRALEAVTADYEYAKGLQLYAVDAYGVRYASQSNK